MKTHEQIAADIAALVPAVWLYNMKSEGGILATIPLAFQIQIGSQYRWPNGEMATVIDAMPLVFQKEAIAQVT